MKNIVIFMFVFSSFIINAQKKSKEERQAILDRKKASAHINKNDTLISNNGMKFYKGAKIKLGVGSTNDGNFKFIRINENSFFNYYGADSQKVNSANSLSRNQSGYNAIIKRVENRGNESIGFVKYAVFNSRGINYEIDIENAIIAREIENDNKKILEKEAPSKFSIADELLKLKKLLDDGIISKEEFDMQKQKLLN